MAVIFKILLVTIFIVAVKTSVLPVGKCKLQDSACMMEAFQKALPTFADGIPEIGVEVLDPMQMDSIAFDLSGLQFSLKDGQLKGLKVAVIDKVKWDLKKKRIEVDYHLNGSVKGHYTAAGRLLILPISGDGQMKLKLKNLSVKMYIDYKMEKGADGKDHVVPVKFDYTFEVKDNAHYNLTNLFNGNKELSDTMLTFLNENWKQVSTEFGRPVMDAAAKKLYSNVVKYFERMPIEEIAIV